jgi:hypothetical protein
MSGRGPDVSCVELLDGQRLSMELMQLERRTARSGRDSVDHPPGGQTTMRMPPAGRLVRAAQHRRRTVRVEQLGGV